MVHLWTLYHFFVCLFVYFYAKLHAAILVGNSVLCLKLNDRQECHGYRWSGMWGRDPSLAQRCPWRIRSNQQRAVAWLGGTYAWLTAHWFITVPMTIFIISIDFRWPAAFTEPLLLQLRWWWWWWLLLQVIALRHACSAIYCIQMAWTCFDFLEICYRRCGAKFHLVCICQEVFYSAVCCSFYNQTHTLPVGPSRLYTA